MPSLKISLYETAYLIFMFLIFILQQFISVKLKMNDALRNALRKKVYQEQYLGMTLKANPEVQRIH